jgi:hypothetical protein
VVIPEKGYRPLPRLNKRAKTASEFNLNDPIPRYELMVRVGVYDLRQPNLEYPRWLDLDLGPGPPESHFQLSGGDFVNKFYTYAIGTSVISVPLIPL